MAEFTDDLISLMAQTAETELADKINCIIERYAPAILAGQAEVTLGSNVIGITRVFWKGKRLQGSRSTVDLINSDSVPYSSEQGEPIEYVTNFTGNPVIRLYPSPNESLSAGVGDLWTIPNIENCLIIECSIAPDFNTQDRRIPSVVRRQYIKDYALYRLLKREGKAMDLKAAKYFQDKFKMDLMEISVMKEQLFACIPKQFQPIVGGGYKVARPVLPSNFGEICE